jgi:hypothetical protein
MSYWLCPRGTQEEPFPADWFNDKEWRQENTTGYGTGIRGTPSLRPGDQIVWYAVTWRVLWGLAEVTGEPEHRQVRDWQEDRWPWYMPVRTSLVVVDLSTAPSLADAGLPWAYVRRHNSLSHDQFVACSRELARVGKPYDSTSGLLGADL